MPKAKNNKATSLSVDSRVALSLGHKGQLRKGILVNKKGYPRKDILKKTKVTQCSESFLRRALNILPQVLDATEGILILLENSGYIHLNPIVNSLIFGLIQILRRLLLNLRKKA